MRYTIPIEACVTRRETWRCAMVLHTGKNSAPGRMVILVAYASMRRPSSQAYGISEVDARSHNAKACVFAVFLLLLSVCVCVCVFRAGRKSLFGRLCVNVAGMLECITDDVPPRMCMRVLFFL
ncbi:hypothetical protein DQ04_01481010 [Trypanosoma grayi]|uniref:hypothetical protein n=1 Tax=Trypanosoma grayi TaxID=71804 RepID=UPI0004F49CD4|nr:hypothetical protein DQ04_01481010 [Trypanosoma grayi]KEG12698.1 hypothetical protein DQ04_01481010 [Trypanosoma grayi]